jgi:hypothetical protein
VPISLPKSLVVAFPPIQSPSSRTFTELTIVNSRASHGDRDDWILLSGQDPSTFPSIRLASFAAANNSSNLITSAGVSGIPHIHLQDLPRQHELADKLRHHHLAAAIYTEIFNFAEGGEKTFKESTPSTPSNQADRIYQNQEILIWRCYQCCLSRSSYLDPSSSYSGRLCIREKRTRPIQST